MSALGFAASFFAAAFLAAPSAFAGGLETPDNGTEALGRGGAFAAKADDPTALHHNIGGLAQQGGTRLLVNANVARNSLSFQREGVYEGDPGTTAWAGRRYPLAENQGGVAVLPFVAATSDFGTERMTFALGTFAPHSVGGKVYPLVQNGAPSPARYDAIGGMPTLLLYHTAAMGYRVADWLDVGVGFHLVQAQIGTRLIAYMNKYCSGFEEAACDARGEATTKGWSGTGSIGAMARLGEGLSAGLHFRGPAPITTEGTAKIDPPSVAKGFEIPATRVMVQTAMPWVVRGGVRKVFGRERSFAARGERGRGEPTEGTGDLELDVVYEGWGSAMNPGPRVVLDDVKGVGRMERTVTKRYSNTLSVRVGGSYTLQGLSVPVTLRGGGYYDGSATAGAYTRLDADTLDKVALTAGVGVRFGSVRIDAAYASAFDFARTVKDGDLRSAEGAPAVNNGVFTGHTHIASLGAVIELDRIFGGGRLPLPKPDGDRVARR
ncbi:MAG: outer membrane protein transport protein [Labilithrix sp.]|nr:outer membrane protein transport protein [Labilithrix sp.]MCW5810004.1 outer membrane protein transport protein [Labilithrix sp.]